MRAAVRFPVRRLPLPRTHLRHGLSPSGQEMALPVFHRLPE
jgi:hypothetical protein